MLPLKRVNIHEYDITELEQSYFSNCDNMHCLKPSSTNNKFCKWCLLSETIYLSLHWILMSLL